MKTGTVKLFYESKGYGYIAPDDGSSDVYINLSTIKGSEFKTLTEGQEVTFEVQTSPKGPQAVSVSFGGPHGGGGGLGDYSPKGGGGGQDYFGPHGGGGGLDD